MSHLLPQANICLPSVPYPASFALQNTRSSAADATNASDPNVKGGHPYFDPAPTGSPKDRKGGELGRRHVRISQVIHDNFFDHFTVVEVDRETLAEELDDLPLSLLDLIPASESGDAAADISGPNAPVAAVAEAAVAHSLANVVTRVSADAEVERTTVALDAAAAAVPGVTADGVTGAKVAGEATAVAVTVVPTDAKAVLEVVPKTRADAEAGVVDAATNPVANPVAEFAAADTTAVVTTLAEAVMAATANAADPIADPVAAFVAGNMADPAAAFLAEAITKTGPNAEAKGVAIAVAAAATDPVADLVADFAADALADPTMAADAGAKAAVAATVTAVEVAVCATAAAAVTTTPAATLLAAEPTEPGADESGPVADPASAAAADTTEVASDTMPKAVSDATGKALDGSVRISDEASGTQRFLFYVLIQCDFFVVNRRTSIRGCLAEAGKPSRCYLLDG